MSPARKSKRTPAPARGLGVNAPGTDRRVSLGGKHTCFACSAKFYDMNRPEVVCPKCGEDQKKRPREPAKPAPRSAARSETARMAPLLEEEDEAGTRRASLGEEDINELGLGGLDGDEELGADDDQEEEDSSEEDLEEA